MPHHTTIKNLDPGSSFYFANDPDKTIYTKTGDFRTTTAKQKFFFCEKPDGSIDNFNETRNVIAYWNSAGIPRQQNNHVLRYRFTAVDTYLGKADSIIIQLIINILTYNSHRNPEMILDFSIAHYNHAIQVVEICKQFSFFSDYRSREFVIAIYKLYKDKSVSLPDLVKAVKENTTVLVSQNNYKEYLTIFSKI